MNLRWCRASFVDCSSNSRCGVSCMATVISLDLVMSQVVSGDCGDCAGTDGSPSLILTTRPPDTRAERIEGCKTVGYPTHQRSLPSSHPGLSLTGPGIEHLLITFAPGSAAIFGACPLLPTRPFGSDSRRTPRCIVIASYISIVTICFSSGMFLSAFSFNFGPCCALKPAVRRT